MCTSRVPRGRIRTILLGVGCAAVLLFGIFLVRRLQATFGSADYQRINEGMTRAEVEAILGPPGDFSSRDTLFRGTPTYTDDYTGWVRNEALRRPPILGQNLSAWVSDECVITVEYEDDCVVFTGYDGNPKEPLLDILVARFRRALGL